VLLGKEVFHTDVVLSSHWNVEDLYRAARTRVKDALKSRGKDEKLIPNTVGIPVVINAKGMKALQITVMMPFKENPWWDIDFHVSRLRRQKRSDIRVTATMRFEIEEKITAATRTPISKEGSQRETATQRQLRQEILLEEINVATGNNVTAIYKAN
jgi:hypothetical protein